MPTLSKSRFLSGLQCEKKLFFDVFHKELRPATDAAQQAVFDTGYEVGKMALQVFPGGKDAQEGIGGDWSIAIQRTADWLAAGVQTIYEATFSANAGFAAVDILHQSKGEWHLIEVKSTTEVKETHKLDAAFQYHVLNCAGQTVDRVFIMHINGDFVKNGPIQPDLFFTLSEITQEVLALQTDVRNNHTRLVAMLAAHQEPTKDIGEHCFSPYDCPYRHHCFAHLPKDHVFELTGGGIKSFDLYASGIHALADVPEDYALTPRQRLQVRGVKYNESHLDPLGLHQFIESIEAPIHFFDFETIFEALPVLDGTKPFGQVPFQYSCHMTDANGNLLRHTEFLAEPADFLPGSSLDPRWKLIQQLKKDIGPKGSIVAHNATFEITRLRELAQAFPSEDGFLQDIIKRMIDFIIPFRKGWIYTPAMRGSASIKKVLPALAPTFSYEDLEIGNGGDASRIFLSMVTQTFSGDEKTARKHLLTYCERDTEAMVIIYKEILSQITLIHNLCSEMKDLGARHANISAEGLDELREAELLEAAAENLILAYCKKRLYRVGEFPFKQEEQEEEEDVFEPTQEHYRLYLLTLVLRKPDVALLMYTYEAAFWPGEDRNMDHFLEAVKEELDSGLYKDIVLQ